MGDMEGKGWSGGPSSQGPNKSGEGRTAGAGLGRVWCGEATATEEELRRGRGELWGGAQGGLMLLDSINMGRQNQPLCFPQSKYN